MLSDPAGSQNGEEPSQEKGGAGVTLWWLEIEEAQFITQGLLK